MNGEKNIIQIEKPVTQTLEAIKSLLAWKGRAADPLPSFVELGSGESRCVLVLNNKRDAYYCVTSRDCSCPSAIYRHNGPCKHQRKYFHLSKEDGRNEAAVVKGLATKSVSAATAASIIPKREPFKPFLEDELRPARKLAKPPAEASASSLSVIDCHDTTALDVAYHSIKLDREMWPLVEA